MQSDAVSTQTLNAGPQIVGGIFAPEAYFTASSDSDSLVKRIIITDYQIGIQTTTLSGAVAGVIFNGVCVMRFEALSIPGYIFPDPEILSDEDARTDWLDLWTNPVAYPGGTNSVNGLAGTGIGLMQQARDIRVARKLGQDDVLVWLWKYGPMAGSTPDSHSQLQLLGSTSVLWRKLSP